MVLKVGLVSLISILRSLPDSFWNDVDRVELMTSVGTDYFSTCFGEHIPDEVDLVLIDMCTSSTSQ
jgi:hypothetical protein